MGWAGHVAHMGETRTAYMVQVRKLEEETTWKNKK
jgi:hypothetical protein